MYQSSPDRSTTDVADESNCDKPSSLVIEPVSFKRGVTDLNEFNHIYGRLASAPPMRRKKADRQKSYSRITVKD